MPGRGSEPIKQQRSRCTVSRLLDAALRVYGELGPQGFAIAPVLERSEISVGSLYHHFGNFDGLGQALLDSCVTDLMETITEELRHRRSAKQGVYALVTTYLRWSVDNRDKALVIHTTQLRGGSVADIKRIREDQSSRLDAIVTWLAPHVAAGRIQALDPGLLEALISAPAAHVVRQWLMDETGTVMEQAIRHLPERVWQSVRGDSAGG